MSVSPPRCQLQVLYTTEERQRMRVGRATLKLVKGANELPTLVQDDVDATFPWSGILTLLVKGKERCCVYHQVLIVGMGWRVL